MNLDDLIKKVTEGDLPGWAMAVVSIVLFLLVIRVVRGTLKMMFLLPALALLAGALWWLLRTRG